MRTPSHFGATKPVFENARQLKRALTSAEKVLWEALRNRKFHGLKFRRQHPVKNYILDFYCFELALAVEVDGNIHLLPEVKERDEGRTLELVELGITVMRFTNEEILNDLDSVLKKIEEYYLKDK